MGYLLRDYRQVRKISIVVPREENVGRAKVEETAANPVTHCEYTPPDARQ